MPADPYTPAELEAGAEALSTMLSDDLATVVTVAVLDAVLPDHDARLRATVAEEIARALLERDPVEWALSGQRAGGDAANIARYHSQEPPG